MEKIIMGSDPWGFELKTSIKKYLEEKGYQIIDVGMHDAKNPVDYYMVSSLAAKKIQKGEADRGILFCGTGMGVAIAANKFKGIYAAVIESEFTAKMCKAVNDANILTMGAMIISEHRAKMAIDAWLNAKHTDGFDSDMGKFLKSALAEIKVIEEEEFKSLD